MSVDDLIDQLASLSLRADQPCQGTSEKVQYKEKGECAIKQLEVHLARIRLGVSKAGSPKKLGDAAKQEGKGLLKIAQAGLRNTTGGLEPLRLAYEASRTLLPLSPFIAAADLTMERLWYKVVSRSVELGDFERGLCASAFLQLCLDRREGDDLIATVGGAEDQADCCVVLVPAGGNEEELRLRPFASPGASGSMALAKLVSGASLNACRCCLEVGSREALKLMVGELGRVAGRWIERVGELGDDATADSYRGLLFKQLWLGCAALEKPNLSAKSQDCRIGRQTALGVLLRKKDFWNPDVFVSHSLRAAVALLERSASNGESVSDAARLSTFCLEGLSGREGQGWPATVDDGGEEDPKLHASWVDWLQHSAGLQQRAGQAAEARRLLRLAYEYVQRCRKRQPTGGGRGSHGAAAECAAYAGILKMHTAAMIMSLHPPDAAAPAPADAAAGAPLSGKQAAKTRGGKKPPEASCPSSAAHTLTARGLDYLGDVVDALEALAGSTDTAGAENGAEASALVVAAVKAWARAKNSCAVSSSWMEGEHAGGQAASSGRPRQKGEWGDVRLRGYRVLADLSLNLAVVRERSKLRRIVERIPPSESLFRLAVDNFLRVAHLHLGTLANATTERDGVSSENGARQALAAAEQILGVAGDGLPSQAVKRVGTGWFGLATSLLDRGGVDTGLEALVRGCRLLESWTEIEMDACDDDDPSGVPEILQTVQLDLRLAKLSLTLQDSAAHGLAAAAAIRALAFCPAMWCLSPGGSPEPSASALALVERFVACRLRCGGSSSSNPAAATGRLTSATAERIVGYLLDDDESLPSPARSESGTADDLATVLGKRGISPAAIVWVLLGACRMYRTHLPLCISEEGRYATGEDDQEEDEERGALSECVEGHRMATQATLEYCESYREEGGDDDCKQADAWEVHARLLAARFEHDLHLVEVSDARTGDETAETLADLRAGVDHATSGAAVASRLGDQGSPSGAPVAAAAAGVFACVRAVLLRSAADHDDDVKEAMRHGVACFDQAVRVSDWAPEFSQPATLGPAGAQSVFDHLNVLEDHYTLHGDALRRAKAAELRLVLVDRMGSERLEASLPQGVASSAASLSRVGAAFQSEGIPGLGPMYGAAAANEAVCGIAAPKGQAVGGGGDNGAAQLEAVRIAVDILRGMCLAEKSDGTDQGEGEGVLLQARRAVSDLGSRAVAPATAAYLASVAGLGLSWIYQRDGRLVEAMGEVRQVMRLCRTWASSGDRLAVADKQVVALSAEKGDCVHDEGSSGKGVTGKPEAEEGIGADTGGVEDTMGVGEDGRESTGVALGSRWIQVYLEGLMRMGRLWRERGVASKASLTLRQGCVMSESLHAARFLRRCLVEEIEVAAGKHQFDRAERLLRASQDLWRQERRELISPEGSDLSAACAGCHAPDHTGAGVANSAMPPAGRGKGSKKGARKPGDRAKSPPATAVAAPGGAACVRCSELAVNAAELAVVEASLLRKQGSFAEALAACERGQEILSPLVDAAGEPVSWNNSLSFARVSAEHGPGKAAQGRGLGWRAAEALAMLRLQQGRVCCLLGNASAGIPLLRECSDADGVPALVRATALYRIGRMSLDVGDAAGARAPLERAEALSRRAGAPKLVRKVRRVLAVVLAELAGGEGLGSVGVDGSWRVAALSSLSVGVTHCNQVAHASARAARKGGLACDRSGVSAGLRLFEIVSGSGKARMDECGPREDGDVLGAGRCLENAVTSDLRTEWPIVSLCLAPGEGACKRLLLTRLARDRPPLTVSVPLSPDDTRLLERWREIMEENRDSLRGHSAEEAAEYGNHQKARWWERRVAVDEMVGGLLRDLQERWLEPHGLAAVLLGDVVGEGLRMRLEEIIGFAADQIHAARGAAAPRAGEKGEARAKRGKRSARAAATTVEGEGGPEAKRGLRDGLSELVRVCVGGGEVVSEDAWRVVIRIALSGAEKEAAAATKISREIHQRVQAAFAAEGVEVGSRGPSCSPAARASPTVRSHPLPSPDIEKGRSCSGNRRSGAVEAATSSSAAMAGSPFSLDEKAMSKMKVADLRRELSARGVSMAGLKLKTDLLARLVEAVRQEIAANGREETEGKCAPDPAEEAGDRCRVEVAPNPATPDGIGASAVRRKGRGNGSPQTAGRAASGKSSDAGGTNGHDVVGGNGGGVAERHPVVLVLDEELQAVPWEGLPCLRGRAVTRVPAVPFVFAALATKWDVDASSESVSTESSRGSSRGSRKCDGSVPAGSDWTPSRDGIRLDRGYYVLDPEANLPHTRKHLGPVFKGLERRLGWSGVQGKAPTEEAMVRAMEEVDIFAYCGHGAGELLVGREAVAGLTKCAAAVLMGCSSGRLKGYGDFEPMGMATSYLMGGSPAVVANLWDVTDKDIDRYSVALFEAFLGGDGVEEGSRKRAPTLAHAVAESRSECKMPFVIGYAPVCYGIPVTAATSLPQR